MPFLMEIIKQYIESSFKQKEDLFYFGDIVEYGENQIAPDIELKLKVKTKQEIWLPSGYLYINPKIRCYDISFIMLKMERYF